MKMEELEKNQALLEELEAEIEKKIRNGQEPVAAKIEVLKAHDIEFDEDDMRASEVDQIKLDLESLQNVSGGRKDPFCMVDYSCYIVARHDDNESRNHACLSNYYCTTVSVCSNVPKYSEREKPWQKS